MTKRKTFPIPIAGEHLRELRARARRRRRTPSVEVSRWLLQEIEAEAQRVRAHGIFTRSREAVH